MKNYKSYSITVLSIVAAVTVFFSFHAAHLEFDYNFEKFFPEDDDDPEFFYNFRKKFGSDNDFVFIALENKNGIFQNHFLQKVKMLSDSLAVLPFVEMVQSPTTLKSFVVNEFGSVEIPFLHVDYPEKYSGDSARIYNTGWLVNSFFSKDAKALTVVVKNKAMLAKKKSDSLLFNIEHLLKNSDFDSYHIAGRIHAQHYFLSKMQKEIFLFFFTSLALVMLLLFIAFRTTWGVFYPIIAVIVSILWLLGFMQLSGKTLDLFSSLLPTIIFIVGMSDAVHIVSNYMDEIAYGKGKAEALKITIKEIGWATFLTSLTTAIGFLSLCTLKIVPVKQFGLYSALGVCMSFVAAYMVLPPLLLLLKKPSVGKISQPVWQKKLSPVFRKIIRHRNKIIVGSFLLFFISLFGISRLKINNFLLEDLPNKDECKKEYLYFENKFSGVRPFEMSLQLRDSNKTFFDVNALYELEKTENFLKQNYGVGFLISPLSIIKSANQAANGGSGNEYKIPDTQEKLTKANNLLKRIMHRNEINMVITDDMQSCRISGKMPDYGGLNIKKKNAELNEFMQKNIAEMDYKITGMASLIDKNSELLAQNMLYGLLIAVITIALICGIIYRSVIIVLIALFVNILPLMLIGALMGFLGVDLKISTSVVFTIAFGIAVDDTIHFLSRMKLELKNGKNIFYAVKRTYFSTGKALVLTTIILSGGFLTLILSGFTSSFYIGLFISCALIFALAGDMILLPVLLVIFFKPRNSSTKPLGDNSKCL